MPSLPSSPPLHLLSPACLPSTSSSPFSLSILTYNVLLPNSKDGWWNYKMYDPSTLLRLDPDDSDDITDWTYRRNLLRNRIARTDPDVVCFQEVSPLSFEEDFSFMKEELGYDGSVLFKKGRFRPATFWREDRWRLVEDAVHKDRTLLTVFESVSSSSSSGEGSDDGHDDNGGGRNTPHWHVLNCHLQAGNEGKRRVRQIDEGVKTSTKAAKRLKEPNPTDPNLIVCGDFNSDDASGAVRYLEDGLVTPDLLEGGIPVSSKTKTCPLSVPMRDAAAAAAEGRGGPPPPTLVVNELISLLEESGEGVEEGEVRLTEDVLERLRRAYGRYATHGGGTEGDEEEDGGRSMDCADVERWLVDINKQLGRGSEFRTAAKEMGWVAPPPPPTSTAEDAATPAPKPRIVLPPSSTLTLSGFQNVYRTELRQGKYWGIAHDLAVMGEPLPAPSTNDADGAATDTVDRTGFFEARFDRIYYHGGKIRPTAVLDTVAVGHCPSEVEPSDHLPVAARFELISRGGGGDGGNV